MISKDYLRKISRQTDLHLYQQEKDYLLKLFLYFYYRRYDDVVFKGGTCIKYVFGLNRFSEDLDFELRTTPEKFGKQIERVFEDLKSVGLNNHYLKKEKFEDALTAEVAFQGPRYNGTKQSRNKFRIDAGKRLGLVKEPKWKFIKSEYPETTDAFSVYIMDPVEILAEKVISLFDRSKGKDLYDVWFMINNDYEPDFDLIKEKYDGVISWSKIPGKKRYEEDLKRLTSKLIPYSQVEKEVKSVLEPLLDG
ncbi:MAG: nucleotidyl transferase AbiEii/AbiGii toxin family protein [Candidatus Aenigmatarchaeota archaeon]